MKQETERGIVIVSQPDIENPTKERAILHAQQTSATIGTYSRKWDTPVVNILQMAVHPQFIQTGQQRRRERRKYERKNKRK